jgi:phosphate:Na+ symporter
LTGSRPRRHNFPKVVAISRPRPLGRLGGCLRQLRTGWVRGASLEQAREVNPNIALISFIGAVALLLYGINMTGQALQRVAGPRLRRLLALLGENRLTAVAVGALVTAMMQSSGATTMMLVGFARAGLIEMRQTVGLILGADIGSTLTVQLLAFRIYDYALLLVALGVGLYLSGRHRTLRDIGQVILGFGLVFLALRIIIDTVAPLRTNPLVFDLFAGLGEVPLLAFLIAAIFTAITTSSTATIGIALALAVEGVMPLATAVPIVLGANLGTTAPAFISSAGSTPEARRVALAHVLFKLVGVAIFLPFISQVAALAAMTPGDVPRQIANLHTAFNVAITLLFLPIAGPVARLLSTLVPDVAPEEGFRPRYLDASGLESPALALGQATREVLRMADLVLESVEDTLSLFRDNDERRLEEIEKREDQIDFLEQSIKSYLTQLSEQSLSEEQSRHEIGLLYLINELEHIGDIVDKSSVHLARQKILGRLTFSAQGMREVQELHSRVVENLRSIISAIATRDQELAQKVLSTKAAINKMERELRQTHIRRLHAGTRESIETSSIHMDFLNDLKRINSHTTNMAYVVLGEL